MGAVLIEVADAVSDALNGHDFGIPFTAQRSYADWNDELADLAEVKVDVVPFRSVPDLDSVGTYEIPVTIDILIRKHFDYSDQDSDQTIPNEIIDPLIKLVQDVWEFFAPSQANGAHTGRLTLTSGLSAAWDSDNPARVMADYVRPHLRKMRQFTGWIRVGYVVSKEPD